MGKSDTHQAPGYILSYIITSLLVSVGGKSDTQTCEGSTPLKIFIFGDRRSSIYISTHNNKESKWCGLLMLLFSSYPPAGTI